MLAIGHCGGQLIVADPGNSTGNRLYDPNNTQEPLQGIRRYEQR